MWYKEDQSRESVEKKGKRFEFIRARRLGGGGWVLRRKTEKEENLSNSESSESSIRVKFKESMINSKNVFKASMSNIKVTTLSVITRELGPHRNKFKQWQGIRNEIIQKQVL